MLDANKLGALGLLLTDAMTEALGNLSPSAAALLLTLHYHGDMTATALAAIAGVAQPTAVRVADGLVRGGLVRRLGRSGRAAPLGLTSAGRRRAETLQQARLAVLDGLLRPFDLAERARFMRSVDRLLAGATRSRGFARTTCRLCDHGRCDGPRCPIGIRAGALERQEQGRHADRARGQTAAPRPGRLGRA